MIFNNVQKDLLQEYWPVGNNGSKGIRKTTVDDEVQLNWQLLFLQSRANGCCYDVEALPHLNWDWPKKTWFQDRLSHHLKDREIAGHEAKTKCIGG